MSRGAFLNRDQREESTREALAADAALLIVLMGEVRDVTPKPEDSDREVWMKLGERRLIEWLQQLARNGGADL